MKKPLEDFFKKKLDSDVDEGWNMPSDDIWEKALPHFNTEQPKRKFGFWWWFIGISLLLITVGILYTTTFNNDSIENNILSNNNLETKKERIAKKSQHESSNQEIEFDTDVTHTDMTNNANDSNSAKKEITAPNTNRQPSTTSNNTSQDKTNSKQITLDAETNTQVGLYNQVEKNTKFNQNTKAKKKDLVITDNHSNLTNKLPILLQKISNPTPQLEILSNTQKIISLQKKKSWMIFTSYLPALSRLDIVPQNENISGNKQYHFSNSFNIGITRILNNNWALQTGIGLNNIVSKTETKQPIIYNKATEITMADNMIGNPISFQATSPFGTSNMATMVTMPASMSIPSGDVVDAHITNNQAVSYLHFPLGLRFQKQISAHFSAFTTFGIEYNYLIKNNAQTTGRMTHGADQMGLKVMNVKRMDQLSKSVFSASIGLGIERKISSKISLFSNFNYQHSLTPVLENALHKTNFSKLQLGIGIGYNF